MKNDFYDHELVPDVDMPAEFIEKQKRFETNVSESTDSFIPRRQFLKMTGIAGGGLVLAFSLSRSPLAQAAHHGDAHSTPFSPNAFIQIKADGSIVIAAKNPEVGQGIKTFLPMIIAEELEVPWESVTVEQSAIDAKRFGPQSAGGSQSTPSNWDPLRQAGAVARTMLTAAAAKTWGIQESQCKADQGFVFNKSNGEKLSYAELAATASDTIVSRTKALSQKYRNFASATAISMGREASILRVANTIPPGRA